MPIDWNEDMTTMLKDLLEKGLSGAQASFALSERFGILFSRNAVIGRAHRLKLSFKRIQGQKNHPANKAKQTVKRMRIIRIVDPASIDPSLQDCEIINLPHFLRRKEGQGLSIIELNGDTCRWPVGERPPYKYCGDPLARGAYCREHGTLAYVEPRVRWGRR